jgi:hypothetical protein
MNCEWPSLAVGTPCDGCGYRLKRDYPSTPRRTCGKRPGLGDRIESALSAIGITPERWVATKELIGLPPTCGCMERKESLNRLDSWLRELGQRLGDEAQKVVAKLIS